MSTIQHGSCNCVPYRYHTYSVLRNPLSSYRYSISYVFRLYVISLQVYVCTPKLRRFGNLRREEVHFLCCGMYEMNEACNDHTRNWRQLRHDTLDYFDNTRSSFGKCTGYQLGRRDWNIYNHVEVIDSVTSIIPVVTSLYRPHSSYRGM